jgi:DNA repair exonuclease SbcCD ATPase subunit
LVPSPEQLQELALSIVQLRSELSGLSNNLKSLKQQLHQTKTTVPPSVDSLREKLNVAETERDALVDRLMTLRSGDAKPVDPEQKAKLETDLKFWKGTALRRKNIVKEIWGVIADGLASGGASNEDIASMKVSCYHWTTPELMDIGTAGN